MPAATLPAGRLVEPKLVSGQVTPPFPLNPFVGQVWLNWIWNGSIWVCNGQGPLMMVRTFTASGTYFPSAGLSFAIVECIGGGTLGGYSRSSIPLGLLQPSVTVTIVGGDVSFGTLVVAYEGGGAGGMGAPAGVGDVALPGGGSVSGLCVVTEWSVGPASMVELCAPDAQKAEAHAH